MVTSEIHGQHMAVRLRFFHLEQSCLLVIHKLMKKKSMNTVYYSIRALR